MTGNVETNNLSTFYMQLARVASDKAITPVV